MEWPIGVTPLTGLSPRLRGNPMRAEPEFADAGSIPAPAGEPWWRTIPPMPEPVYPRACGGTWGDIRDARGVIGLSPRLRGNPYGLWWGAVQGRVYPRACGGTSVNSVTFAGLIGLSPRLRGNLSLADPRVSTYGSIPAPAGEPPP